MCGRAADTLDQSDISSDFRKRLDTDSFRLTFPYRAQAPYDGADSGCLAQVDPSSDSIAFSITPDECLPGTQCERMYVEQLANRRTEPWATTKGVPFDVYVNQRQYDHDWNICYCAVAGRDFDSEQCSCSEPVDISSVSGGVCQCHILPGEPESPQCANCVDLKNRDQITVLNGYEDLFIQWTYGRELVRAYKASLGDDKAEIVTYPGPDGAGHGLMLQHPKWTQEQIYAALTHD